MEKFLNIILGGMEPVEFLAYYTIAFVSAFVMLLIRADKKRKNSIDTPDNFNIKFFIQDNILKFVINIFAIGFAIIFSNQLIGSQITGWGSLVIGIGLNKLVVKLQSIQNKARE